MKPTLPTNYKDDILNTSVEGMRRYQMIYNSDNTVSFKDVTPYDQTGSDFGAGDINLTNEAVNQSADAGKIIDDPDTAEATTEEGYIAGVQLFNHVNDSLANGQISFDVVDGEPYVAVNGGTPRPFDSRHFIVKNGVVQNGYTLVNHVTGTAFAETGNGYLLGGARLVGVEGVDITKYKKFCITMTMDDISIGTGSPWLFLANGINPNLSLSSSVFPANLTSLRSCGSVYDISNINGVYAVGFHQGTSNPKRIYDMWFE